MGRLIKNSKHEIPFSNSFLFCYSLNDGCSAPPPITCAVKVPIEVAKCASSHLSNPTAFANCAINAVGSSCRNLVCGTIGTFSSAAAQICKQIVGRKKRSISDEAPNQLLPEQLELMEFGLAMAFNLCLQNQTQEVHNLTWEQAQKCENDFPEWIGEDFEIPMPTEEEFNQFAGDDNKMDMDGFFGWAFATIINATISG